MIDALLVGAEELENLGTRYLASVLRQAGYIVELAAFSRGDELAVVVERAALLQPRLIGLSVIFQFRAQEFISLANELKRRLPEAHITAGGHFPTFCARELLRDTPGLDSVVRGEGEQTLLELMDKLDRPESWPEIFGLSFRSDVGVVENSARPLTTDLDSIPLPARDTAPQQYLGIGLSPILGSRGCYRDCAFCSIRAFYGSSHGKPQRFRRMSCLVDEMETLYHGSNVRFFIFNDDEWFAPGHLREPRVAEFERELGRRGLDSIMSIKCRADDVDESLFRRLKDLGVVRAYVGIESGSEHSLKTLNKKTTVRQNRNALEVLHRVGMLADFGMIFFDPDSTVEDVRANLSFFHDMAGAGEAPLSFGRMEVYAGTPILARLLKEGRLIGSYLAWNYAILDPRVELLFRMMVAVLGHRNYSNEGMCKQSSVGYYELTMYEYLKRERRNRALREQLRELVARVNSHSLSILGEMLDFTLQENIYDVNRVNDQVAEWATEVNLFDVSARRELDLWRALVAADCALDG